MRFELSFAYLLVLASSLQAQEPALVAPTNALTPAEEQKKLIVPEGFEIQLVASEPDIQKPMQQAFDAKGRIWVTTSYHYPFAAPAGKGTDKLFILSDFGPDGKARKVQTFAADLNIPIGILPLPDCNSCIVSSVGEILKLTDTDGDGKYDKKEVLFTGLGSRDTHGMYNSFTLMPDGWVYACHGFNNDSKTKGKDGHEVAMRSGNTFRFRPDGSRIEVYTRGQVNPFGMAVDPWFNLYTADCHSKPITNLIPGATYESFNSTSDPLGFGPVMFGYDPGGTGLCGLSWYDADHFPARFKGHMFLGNVVTSRVNMCKIEWTGATPKAVQQPDFVKSDDPWFRPVDIKLGPDGAIYISDFYNKIIGHYEVDLKHPGRDKDRGRLWRVVYKGGPKPPRADWTKATDTELVTDLTHANMTVRFLAGNEYLHRSRSGKSPKSDDSLLFKYLQDPATASGVAGWLSFAGEAEKNPPNYADLVSQSKSLKIAADGHTTLVLRAMASKEKWEAAERKLALEILMIDAPRLKRATVEAMGAHPHPDFVRPLVELLGKILSGDDHFKHATRIALRNCLRDADGWKALDERDIATAVTVILAVPTPQAARILARNGKQAGNSFRNAIAEHVGRYGNKFDRQSIMPTGDPALEIPETLNSIQSLVRGMQLRGERLEHEETEFVLDYANKSMHWINSKVLPKDTRPHLAAARLLAEIPSVFPVNFRIGTNPNIGEKLLRTLAYKDAPLELRIAAMDAIVRIDPQSGISRLRDLLNDPETSDALKDRIVIALAGSTDREGLLDARDVLKDSPYSRAMPIALALAGSRPGGEILLEAVKQGKAPARVLQEKNVLDRLRAAKIENLEKQIADLTKGLPPADQKLAELIKQRSVKFTSAKPDKEAGLKLFTKHCGACHKIGEAGGKVGPNLDGIGVRGLERLLEDTLDPNRNVDAAFRARVLNLVDGTTKTGLMLRVEGEVLVMADDQGKEFRVPTKEIDKNRETMLSPMPANFGETIPEAEFYQIMAYLLDQKAKEPPKK